MKPLNRKSYGSIPHLSSSKLGEGDHYIHNGQERILTERKRDKHDVIIIQEKYDGSNVAVAKINNEIVPLTRSGYLANTSPYEQHHLFCDWAIKNKDVFYHILNDGERICGEWLAMAHGIRYSNITEPFVAFDLFTADNKRASFQELQERIRTFFHLPYTIQNNGEPMRPEAAFGQLESQRRKMDVFVSDKPEGLVYRCERKGRFDFMAKWVRQDFEPGRYFADRTGKNEVWNWRPEKK